MTKEIDLFFTKEENERLQEELEIHTSVCDILISPIKHQNQVVIYVWDENRMGECKVVTKHKAHTIKIIGKQKEGKE